MKALLIIAHGSRNQNANAEIRRLAKHIEENNGPSVDRVGHCFLESSPPQPRSAIADLIDEGVEEIKVFPYFLVAGTHVANDIPRIIADVKKACPAVHFEILPHLGALQGIGALVLRHIDQPESSPVVDEGH